MAVYSGKADSLGVTMKGDVLLVMVRLVGRALWLAVGAGGVFGVVLLFAALNAEAAPAQGAAAAAAAACGILPYVLARAWDEIFAPIDMRRGIRDAAAPAEPPLAERAA